MEKKPLIILTGPTAVGKTSLSLRLARAVGGEIISADSMQIYKKMKIGTARITLEEMEGIPHYLVGELDPREEFNVSRFQQMAREAMDRIYANGHIPIIVGGTGFYIQALVYDIDFSPHDEKETYRKELSRILQEKGKEYLHDRLKEVDPEYAASVHSNNVKRVIRALEYHHETGEKLSAHNQNQRERVSPYNFAYFVLDQDRAELYRRIDQRVDRMIEKGLEEEVRELYREGYTKDMVSMQGIGYKEFFPYFEGQLSSERTGCTDQSAPEDTGIGEQPSGEVLSPELTCRKEQPFSKLTLEEVVENIKKDTRHFAKRQLTWFRREKEVIWIRKQDYADEEILLGEMLEILKDKEIIL